MVVLVGVHGCRAGGPALPLAATAAALFSSQQLLRLGTPRGRPAAASAGAALHSSSTCAEQYDKPDIPSGDPPDTFPPDVVPDPSQPRRNPDIYPPSDTPDFPDPRRTPSPDVFPRYPHPDINPPDIGPPDFPSPGRYMATAVRGGGALVGHQGMHRRRHPIEWPPRHGAAGLGGQEASASLGRAALRSPLFSWPHHLPLLKTDGGSPLLEAQREAGRLAGDA